MAPVLVLPTLPPLASSVAAPAAFNPDQFFVLPPIGVPIDQAPSPCQEVTNPGTSQPQRQQHARPTVDQTMSVTMSSAGTTNSNGDFQRKDLSPGQQGITVEATSARPMLRDFNGQFQMKDLNPTDQGTVVSTGPALPRNVMVGDQNMSKMTKEWAPWAPPAVTVDAGVRRAGNGATPDNVNIR